MRSPMVSLVLVSILASSFTRVFSRNNFELPLLPSTFPTTASLDSAPVNGGKRIPKNLWLAVTGKGEGDQAHLVQLSERNQLWKKHSCDQKCRDEFINTHYRGSSIQWAYNIINPAAGAARLEIWKYSVLYMHGGVVIDDDSDITTPLDEIIQPTDSLILSEEVSPSFGECFVPNYHLADQRAFGKYLNASQAAYFSEPLQKEGYPRFFHGNMLANWAIFAMPRHLLLLHTLQHLVEIIKAEYLRRSVVMMTRFDSRVKLYKCATQFVMTYTLRELALENSDEFRASQPRVVSSGFIDYKGKTNIFKKASSTSSGGSGGGTRGSLPHLLSEHSSVTVDTLLDRLNGRAIMADNGKSIYLIINGTKRAFPDFDTFQRMKFSGNQIKYLRDSVLEKIPSGPSLPSLMDAPESAVASSPLAKIASTTNAAFSSNGGDANGRSSYFAPTSGVNVSSSLVQRLNELRMTLDKKGVGCWGDDYTGSRDDFLNNRFKDILGDLPAMVYPLCVRLFQLGNTLGYYFNDIACADVSRSHFIGVGKHFSLIEPEQLATSPEHHFAFFKALPDLLVHPDAAPVETVKQNMKKDCQCLQYCWENSVAPWLKRPQLIKRYLLPAIDAYMTAANAVAVGTLLSNSTDLSTEPMTSFLPLIPHVAIQYRCGDNIGFGKTNYGLLPFYGITARIPPWSKYIYVMADSPTRQKHHTYSGRCSIILEALFDYIRKRFPKAVVVVKRGGDQFLDYARLAYANVTVCSASTFCLWPAMSNSGAAYFPLTPLVGKSGTNATTKYLGPNFHWIREVEIIKEFKQFRPWTSILKVLEGRD